MSKLHLHKPLSEKPLARSKPTVDAQQRRRMIEEAAYYRALTRQLEGGDPVADWLEAEREINRRLART